LILLILKRMASNRTSMLAIFLALLSLTAVAAESNLVICVSNEKSGDVTLIDDSQKIIATIPVGKRPRGIHTSPDGRLLYVALSGSPISGPRHVGPKTVILDDDDAKPADHSADGIGVVDLVQRKFLRKIPSGSDPEQFEISADGAKLFIANEDAGAISIVDTASGEVKASVPVAEEPEGMALTPDGKYLYVTCETRGDVFVIDTGSHEVRGHFTVAGRPRNVAFLPDGSRAFVPAESRGVIEMIDTASQKVLAEMNLPTNSRPMGLAMAADGKTLFVTTGWGGTVCALNTNPFQVSRAIQVGSRAWGIAISPDGKKLYVANGPSNDISIVDVAAGREMARIKVGNGPWGVAVAQVPQTETKLSATAAAH